MNLDWLPPRWRERVQALTDSPLWPTLQTLWQRFEQDRLGVTASSLTFTTVLALVPFFAVVLAVFTAFPEFEQLQQALQAWLVDSLIPAGIAQSVMDYLTQFASQASGLGMAGFAMLFVTTLSLLLTMDTTLNAIWRVRRPRPLSQRLLVYWALLTAGPLVMGGSLAITSLIVSHSGGLLPRLPGGVGFALSLLQGLLLAAGMTLLYRFVPNTSVRWAHALAGGVFASACMALVRWGMGWYLARIPTYSVIYGTFATVPLLLLWVYITWLTVLLGAVIAAYLPVWAQRGLRRGEGPGWDFQLAAESLQALAQARSSPARGLSQAQLAQALRVDALQLTPALEALQNLNWVGQLAPSTPGAAADDEALRYVLLAPPETPLAPLLHALLLAPSPDLPGLWQRPGGWASASLADVLMSAPATPATLDGPRP